MTKNDLLLNAPERMSVKDVALLQLTARKMRDQITALLDAIQPTRDGKRDGGTFGNLSIEADNAAVFLDALNLDL